MKAVALNPKSSSETLSAEPLSPVDGYFTEVFESFEHVPLGWYDLCEQDDLAMDPKILHAYQQTLLGQCRLWGVIVYAAPGAAIGCAVLCRFQTQFIQSSHPLVRGCCEQIQRFFPNFGKIGMLFCGLSFPAGSTNIRVKNDACTVTVFNEVEKTMQHLATQTGCRLLLFKELADKSPLEAPLYDKKYIRGAIPPLHVLDCSFKDFAEYRSALKSRYRAQILRSQKKLISAGFEVIHGRGHAFFVKHFNQRAHELYIEMYRRAEHKMEVMPLAFFHEMAAQLDNAAFLTLIYRNGIVCGFTFSFMQGEAHYNTYSGVDYSLNNKGDLYFNLFYNAMDQAFKAGSTQLYLGQTSDNFKSRLGTTTKTLWYFVRARSVLLNTLLRLSTRFIAPVVIPIQPNDVFNKK